MGYIKIDLQMTSKATKKIDKTMECSIKFKLPQCLNRNRLKAVCSSTLFVGDVEATIN